MPARKGKWVMLIVVSLAVGVTLAAVIWTGSTSPKPLAKTAPVHGTLIDSPPDTNSVAGMSLTNAPSGDSNAGAFAGNVAEAPPPTAGGYMQLTFLKLASFHVNVIYQMTDPVKFTMVPKLSRPIPDDIKSLNNREVALKGFMLPLKLENAQVTEFLLMRNRSMCCFGKPLQINELAYVRMKDKGVKSIMDQPLTVYGTLHVGEINQNGRMAGIYEMDGEKMDEPENFR